MKVIDLIIELQKFDGNLDVMFANQSDFKVKDLYIFSPVDIVEIVDLLGREDDKIIGLFYEPDPPPGFHSN